MAAFRSSVRWIRLSVGGGCALLLAQACGGRSDTRDYLFGPDGTIVEAGSSTTAGEGTGATSAVGGANSTGGTRTTGGSRNTGGSGVTTGGAGTVGGAAVTGGSGPIGGNGTVGGTGTVGGAGPIGGTGIGGTGVAGAAGAPNDPTITCGNQDCNARTQQCCATLGGLTCIGANADCNGATLGCTVRSDCDANQVCCFSITGDASAASTCKASCQNMGPGRDRQLCQTAADCRPPFRFCTDTVFGVSICTRNP